MQPDTAGRCQSRHRFLRSTFAAEVRGRLRDSLAGGKAVSCRRLALQAGMSLQLHLRLALPLVNRCGATGLTHLGRRAKMSAARSSEA